MIDGNLILRHKQWDMEISTQSRAASDTWVVCLHGLQSRKELFQPLFQRLLPSDFSLLSLDFVGFGHSSKPEDFSYALEDQAVIVRQVLERLNVQSLFLIGHSMGGMVSTMLLKDLEKQLRGFVNMEGNFVLEDCGASLPASQATYEHFAAIEYPKLQQELVTSDELSAAVRREALALTPAYAFYHTSRSIVEWSRSQKLIPLFMESRVKKVFVYGERNHRKASVLPNTAAKVEIPNAGHFMWSDNPEETLRTTEDFLLTVPSGRNVATNGK